MFLSIFRYFKDHQLSHLNSIALQIDLIIKWLLKIIETEINNSIKNKFVWYYNELLYKTNSFKFKNKTSGGWAVPSSDKLNLFQNLAQLIFSLVLILTLILSLTFGKIKVFKSQLFSIQYNISLLDFLILEFNMKKTLELGFGRRP